MNHRLKASLRRCFFHALKEVVFLNFISMLFKSRAPTNRTAGSAYGFFMGSSAAGKRGNERTAMQTSAVGR